MLLFSSMALGAETAVNLLPSGSGDSTRTESEPAAFFFGTMNDNYTGSTQNGVDGTYIGADDFLTFSFQGGLMYRPYRVTAAYNIITSRAFGFRYDLLTLNAAREFLRGPVALRPGLDLHIKGRMGGETVQNGFHSLKSLPELHLPYDKSGAGAGVTGEAEYALQSVLVSGDRMSAEIETRLSSLLPFKLGLSGSYALAWRRVGVEAMVGARLYSESGRHYGEFVRSGPVAGGEFNAALYKRLALHLGAAFFPSENLDNDPLYQDKDFSFSPQLWIIFSMGKAGAGLKEFLRFF